MKLLILDGPRALRASRRYRGTYRRHPSFCYTSRSDDEINRLFSWFIDAGGELGVVGDLTRAMRYADLLNAYAQTMKQLDGFEVIQVTDPSGERATGQFLGIDLSLGYSGSLLWSGLTSYIDNSANRCWDPVRPRWIEFKESYSKKLNEYGLFETEGHAQSCLQQAISIQGDFPNFFEGGDLGEFMPTGISKIG